VGTHIWLNGSPLGDPPRSEDEVIASILCHVRIVLRMTEQRGPKEA
jgi:hypothetical protein